MELSAFNYTYPEELVAQHPPARRDASRMMVVNRSDHSFIDTSISALPEYLNKGDLLVVNDSKVFPARLLGRKKSGGGVEILLLKEIYPRKNIWSAISTRQKKLREGDEIDVGGRLTAKIIENKDDGLLLTLSPQGRGKPARHASPLEGEAGGGKGGIKLLIEELGLPPLPPYIKRKNREDYTDEDRERYQTVYARHVGSAAAPTAGFHLTREILQKCCDVGAEIAPITLHIGLDTFSPVRTERIEDHKMHGEEYFISKKTTEMINRAKREGRRIVAVGTTTVRALESTTPTKTNLFICPGYKFRVADSLLTNFHQPMSTLLMMVSAFAGREFTLQTYAEAIKRRYRLFSYGDCMLIV